MRIKIAWIVTIVFGVIVLLVLLPTLWMFIRTWQYGGMMGGYGMMQPGGYGYMMPFGWFGMALMWLLPLALVALVIAGVVSLINNLASARKPAATTASMSLQACPNCGKATQAGWNNCPYCGTGLS